MIELNQVGAQTLVSTTQGLADEVTSLYGASGKELIANWGFIFNSFRNQETNAIDWFRLREFFWANVAEDILTDRVFRRGFSLVCLKLLTESEGRLGENIVFSRRRA